MEYFLVRYDSRVVNYELKLFIRLATDWAIFENLGCIFSLKSCPNISVYFWATLINSIFQVKVQSQLEKLGYFKF